MPPLRLRANAGGKVTLLGSGNEAGAELSFVVREGGTDAVVAVAGEIDMSTAPQLDEFLRALVDRDVVVDMSGVPFLDSSGVSTLVLAMQAFKAQGRTLRVVDEQENVRTVFEVTGVYDLLHGDG